MIITESDQDSKSSPLLSSPDSTSIPPSGVSVSQPFPPPYNPQSGSSSMAPASELPFPTPSIKVKGRESAWRRFIKAFCVAIGVYFLLALLAKLSIQFATMHLIQDEPDGPYSSDGRVVRCFRDVVHLEEVELQAQSPAIHAPSTYPPVFPPYTSTISFTIPVSSEHISLFSRGSLDYLSTVKFELSDKSGDDIEIRVDISYSTNTALSRAQVCLLERDEGGRGVGIFTPRSYIYPLPGQTDRLKFAVTIRFPRSGTPENPLVIKSVDTHMGIWSHQLLDLEDRVVFRRLSIQGSNAPIYGDSVLADAANFKTSNAQISGSFNVSHSLTFVTSNAPIKADICLENHDSYNPTQLHATTSNGRIRTPITLLSKDFLNTAAFSANLKTSNGQLDVAFPDAPWFRFSLLELTARTSNAAANVKLHPTYEGYISLKTSTVFTSSVTMNPSTEDPSRQGRHRTVESRKVAKSVFEGGVWWGNDPDKDEGKGKVIVSTSNSDNTVNLG